MVRFFIEHYNRKFKRQVSGISPEALRLLLSHDWPGNVRELRNAIERAMILEEGSQITAPSLPIMVATSPMFHTAAAQQSFSGASEDGLSLEENERQLLVRALEKTTGNQTQAARLLSITRDNAAL